MVYLVYDVFLSILLLKEAKCYNTVNIVAVHKCSLVEMPETVSHLLFAGEIRIFNFVESMNPLNIRKEIGRPLFNSGRLLKFIKVWTRKSVC